MIAMTLNVKHKIQAEPGAAGETAKTYGRIHAAGTGNTNEFTNNKLNNNYFLNSLKLYSSYEKN
jgi:hypothetical protein